MPVTAATTGAQAQDQIAQATAPTGGGWDAAAAPAPQSSPAPAQPSDGTQPSQSPNPNTPTPPAGNTLSATNTPAPTAAPQPVVVTSQKPQGIMGVVDSIADALAGKTKPEIGTDAQGNQYVKQQTIGRGEQWVRIAATLGEGAAKGMQAGKGRNPGAAAAAGFDSAQAQAKDAAAQTPELQKQILANANYQKLRMDAAEQSWHLGQMKHQATEQDLTFAQGQEDRLMKVDGASLLGTAATPNDIDKILKVDPDVMKSMIQNHQVEILPHYNADGTAAGIRVFKMPDNYRKTMEPAGTVFHTFDSTTGQYVAHKSSEPLTAGEVDDYETSASNAAQKFKLEKANIDQKTAETNQANANASKAPSEIAKNKASASESKSIIAKNYAEAGKATAEAANARTASGQDGGNLVDEIGTGHMTPERMSYLMSKNPALLAAVAKKYPNFDSSKAEAYPKVYADFTSSKNNTAGGALNAGGTALQHLHELAQLNTDASHVWGTPAHTAYTNKVDTVASELAKFYGDATIPAIASIKSTLNSTLPGSRAAAIRTQAQSMGDKLDSYEQTWSNAAPSASYQAPMPGISAQAKAARAQLDPRYAQRVATQTQQGMATPQSQPAPAPQTHVFSPAAWSQANPGKDVNAAIAAAKQQGYTVTQ